MPGFGLVFPDMTQIADLPAKLGLMLKAASVSRVALAHRLGVDKSLVGRWLSGAVHPTEHNLARLSDVLAEELPGFRLADWDETTNSLAHRHGLSLPAPLVPRTGPLAEFLASTAPEIAFRGGAYEGFWRTSRPSFLMSDRIFHDYGMIRRTTDGMVEVLMEGSGLDFSGWLFPTGGNVFVYLYDRTGRSPMAVLFKGISLPKAMVLDGILLLATLDPDRTPAALPIILERVGDLAGDRDADLARYREIAGQMPDPVEPLPPGQLHERLYRDAGPAAAANGGEAFLSVASHRSLSRGVAGSDLRG